VHNFGLYSLDDSVSGYSSFLSLSGILIIDDSDGSDRGSFCDFVFVLKEVLL
jgi:hypothetical protein